MAAIIKTEFLKVKRYYILWAGVGLIGLMSRKSTN